MTGSRSHPAATHTRKPSDRSSSTAREVTHDRYAQHSHDAQRPHSYRGVPPTVPNRYALPLPTASSSRPLAARRSPARMDLTIREAASLLGRSPRAVHALGMRVSREGLRPLPRAFRKMKRRVGAAVRGKRSLEEFERSVQGVMGTLWFG